MILMRILRGESGRIYPFKITWTRGGIPDNKGGVYVFVRRRFLVFLEILYIGKAKNFRERLLGHEKWPKAFWMGATERHLHFIDREDERLFAEEDLVRRYQPPMNDMLIPRGANDRPNHVRPKRRWFGFA